MLTFPPWFSIFSLCIYSDKNLKKGGYNNSRQSQTFVLVWFFFFFLVMEEVAEAITKENGSRSDLPTD